MSDEFCPVCGTSQNEVGRLQAWINDLQSGMYINCVYCGHQYGPNSETPATMADVLKQHIGQCLKHPMSALKQEIEHLEAKIKQLEGNFSHFHVDNEINELCALCGLAVINAVHLRSR